MSDEILKGCPFCGSDGDALVGQYGYDYRVEQGIGYIYCKRCYAHGPAAYGEDLSKEAWNKRNNHV